MASSISHPGRLDAFAGREVVFCHQCDNEWYNDEHGLECPRCQSEATEIITRDNDPRSPPEFGIGGPHIFHRTHESDSDPEEADIEDHFHHVPGAGGLFMRESVFRAPPRPRDDTPRPRGAGRTDPADSDAILQRFTEMLNGFSGGQAGRSGPDTLFPPEDDPFQFQGQPRQFRHTTFSGPGFSGGTASFTIAAGPIRGGGARVPPAPDFDAYAPRFRGSPPAVTMISYRSNANLPPRVFGNIMGAIPPPMPHDHADRGQDPNNPDAPGHGPGGLPPGFPAALHNILASLLNPAAAVHGDAVYSQEALDRIITTLMETNPQSNAAPPASQSALDRLERKRMDDEMLGAEGTAECTICISDVDKGEEVVVLPCKHWFHEGCVVMWLKEHNTCPVCRNPIESRNGGGESGSTSGSQPATAVPPPRASPPFPSLFGNPLDPRPGRPQWPTRPARNERPRDENAERLNSIRDAAGVPPYSPPYRRAGRRDVNDRRNSHSPPASPFSNPHGELPQRTRQRSPSPGGRWEAPSPQSGTPGDRWGAHPPGGNGERPASNDEGRRGNHGIFNFLRDQFSRNSGNGSSGNRRRS